MVLQERNFLYRMCNKSCSCCAQHYNNTIAVIKHACTLRHFEQMTFVQLNNHNRYTLVYSLHSMTIDTKSTFLDKLTTT